MSYVDVKSVLGVGITFIVTSPIAVAARFGVRLHHKVGLGADDWLCLPALALVMAMGGVFIAGYATNTIGSHSPDIGEAIYTYHSSQQSLLKIFEYAFYDLQILALTLLKLSVLLFYRRLFVGKAFYIVFWVLASASVAWGLAFVIAWSAECPTLQVHLYSLMTEKKYCANGFAILLSQAVFDVLVDLGILILPIPTVIRLQMSAKRKLAVIASLAIGGLAIACGMTRLVIVAEILGLPLFSHATIGGDSSTDFNGVVSVMVFWGMLECGVGMIAVCLPTLAPMLRGLTLESMMHSFMSLVSLGSVTSNGRSRSSSAVTDVYKEERRMQSSSIANTERRTYANGMPSVSYDSGETPSDHEVWVKRDLSTVASVV